MDEKSLDKFNSLFSNDVDDIEEEAINREIIIKNLPLFTNENELKTFLKSCGLIEKISINKNKSATIRFKHEKSVKFAFNLPRVFKGNKIGIFKNK